jgi:SPOR domain
VRMSISKIPASPKNYPDEYERRFRVGGARPASVEDVGLAELARKLAPVRPSPEAQAVSEYDQWGAAPIEAATTRSAIDFVRSKPGGPARRDLEATQISGFAVSCSRDLHYPGPATGRRSRRWTRTLVPAGAALLFGAALFVAVFAPNAGSTGARSHVTQPALVKIVGSEELPTAVHADASPAATSSSEPSEPSPTELATPTSVVPPATPFPPVVAVKIADSGPGVSQSLRTMSAAPEATAAPSATQASVAAPPDAPQRPAELVPKVERKVLTAARPPTPNLDRPTKLSRKTLVRGMVAKTAATAPSSTAEVRRQPQRPGASTIAPAPATPQTTPASATGQESVNPVTHVFGTLAGALGAPTVDQTASKSGDWAIQFAAPKSEAEAKVTAARLNAKYAPALNGATIGVHKTQVNGETTYALRVAGLSKADATALCVRVKGRDCSIAK